MAGPGGESCATCYYYDEIQGSPEGYCRHENARTWVEARGDVSKRLWPRVNGSLDWSGDWRDRAAPLTGILATGGAIAVVDTPFVIPSGGAWTPFLPGNMVASSVVQNVTLANDTLTWVIPGTFPVSTVFTADFAIFGSITFNNSADDVRFTLGRDDNTPFSDSVFQRFDVTGSVDDISLPFGFGGGPALSTQTGNVRVLCQNNGGSSENVVFNSLYFQIRITAFDTA